MTISTGDRVRGDYNFSDDYISQILGNGLDLACGEEDWKDGLDRHVAMLTSLGPSLQSYKAKKELDRILGDPSPPPCVLLAVIHCPPSTSFLFPPLPPWTYIDLMYSTLTFNPHLLNHTFCIYPHLIIIDNCHFVL